MIAISPFEMEIVLDIIKNHAEDCHVLAFGSRYKWILKDYSDLDLAFVPPNGEKLGFKRMGQLQEAFGESDLPYGVDVVDYNGVSKEFREIINGGNEIIYKGRVVEKRINNTISRLLSVIDDKIANNIKINHHLKEMAREIFKHCHNIGEIGEDFTEKNNPMFENIRHREVENARLETLRDTLVNYVEASILS